MLWQVKTYRLHIFLLHKHLLFIWNLNLICGPVEEFAEFANPHRGTILGFGVTW